MKKNYESCKNSYKSTRSESSTLENLEEVIDKSSHGKIHDMLLEMEKKSLANPVRILKGSVDVMIELAKSNPNVNAAELNGKLKRCLKKEKLP